MTEITTEQDVIDLAIELEGGSLDTTINETNLEAAMRAIMGHGLHDGHLEENGWRVGPYCAYWDDNGFVHVFRSSDIR